MKIIKLFKILNENLITKSYFIIFFMILGSFLEMVGISLILPLLTILADFDGAEKYFYYLNFFFDTENLSHSEILFKSCIIIGLVFLGKNLFLTYLNFIQVNFIKKFHQLLGKKLIGIYLTRPLNYFLDKNSSSFIRNLSTELTMLSASIMNYGVIILEIFVLFFIFSFLLIYQFKITIILMSIFITFILFYFLITRKKIDNWGKQRHDTEESKIKILKEALLFIREIRLYNLEKYFTNTFDKSNKKYAVSMLKHNFLQLTVRYDLEVISVILILILVNYINLDQNVSSVIPIIGLYVGSAFRMLPSLNRIINAFQQIRYIDPIINNFSQNCLNEKNNDISDKSLNFDFKNKINFSNVKFQYEENKLIFNNLNLEFKKGNFIVIIGDSGSGKSTLLDLLAGFVSPLEGEILVDETFDINKNSQTWHTKLSYSPQNNIILDDNIINNITLFNESIVDNDKLNEAIAISELTELIKDLPEGLNTKLGELGNRFSGGQKQRLGIARTIYKDKSLMLFDEATNALDKKTNLRIIKNLHDYCKQKNKTIIFITHNQEVEKFGDKVINLNSIDN